MIKKIRANKPSFHETEFTSGVNIILADRSASATKKDTTNGLGKSTLIEIIDFCLGGNRSKKGLGADALAEWSFTLDLTVGDNDVSVTRATDKPNFIQIDGSSNGWCEQPTADMYGMSGLNNEQWKNIIAQFFFGINNLDSVEKYRPSARSLLPYFIRSQAAAYQSPFKHTNSQLTWNWQLNNAFLLGLDWKKSSDRQRIRDKAKVLDELKEAIDTGIIDGELKSVGELEAERLQLTNKIERDRKALESFQVHPQYRAIEKKANSLTAEIHKLVNENVTDKRRLDRYQESIKDEEKPSEEKLEEFYVEVDIALPDTAIKTLNEAREFNKQLIINRQNFIAAEIISLEEGIGAREEKITNLTNQRAEYLNTLSGQGALEEYTKLQELYTLTCSQRDILDDRITQVRRMTSIKDEIKAEVLELKRKTELDHEDRRQVWSQALTLFSDFSERLYNSPGSLAIDIDNNGYKFDVEIEKAKSQGIGMMKIFCYDLMLVSFACKRGLGIDFLIHDSNIFHGVDARQIAHAIELAAEMSKKYGFQYICAFNDNEVPRDDFSSDFDYESLIRLRLTDTEPKGSLLGFNY